MFFASAYVCVYYHMNSKLNKSGKIKSGIQNLTDLEVLLKKLHEDRRKICAKTSTKEFKYIKVY